MTTYRLVRSPSFTYQLCSRGLSTEPAVQPPPIRPPKTAVRTSQTDPTNHTRDDISKLYTMPKEVRTRLFPEYVLPLYYERLVKTFNESTIMAREPALELMEYLKRADYNRPIVRYVIYGKFGSGKTMTLIHAMNYALNNGFVIVYVPSVWKWFHWSKEVVSVQQDTDTVFDLPLDAGSWLKHFDMINGALIKDLDLRVSQTYEWSKRESTAEGSSLNDIVAFGINRVKFACQVIDVLLKELKLHSRDNKCKTFVAIDGYNGFFQKSSRLKTPEKVNLVPTKATLTHSFVSLVKNDWNNGAAVLIADDHASVLGKFSSHLPFHLLQKDGVESIDPFIPINVPEYSPLEFHNYLDYLEEMRYLQKPDGREEIDFVTQRNPRLINCYCANR